MFDFCVASPLAASARADRADVLIDVDDRRLTRGGLRRSVPPQRDGYRRHRHRTIRRCAAVRRRAHATSGS